ncbi:MAG: IclR family transcriptional regulator [Candidatus Accumulibacter sp.]|jgi:DNA-binding IclR family transcriptional regulator|uniref:IclR family transcriptional regulator n=1 Tax=Accumulibacter sp. TaxID=2053492 RepID=UPI001AC4B8D6|nr:IclR family transcriptional regulator [Accumulibacter sp.]MBN8437872.1 IclR family transcriptional regulator [Accumulibacter sp.]
MNESATVEPTKQRQGIQSIEVGARLLRALAANGRSMMLRDVARNAGMPAAKAHRYLVSFMRMGLVEQDANTGRYDLGEFSLELGLASLARLDPVRLAGPVLDDLCERLGETVALAMWGNHGATCVRWVEAGGPVTVTLRTGVVLPLTASATGLAFAAFYRSPYLRRMLDNEVLAMAEVRNATPTALLEALTVRLDEIRRRGIARASGSFNPGINGFSAPVFDHTGHMVAAITSLGIIGSFDLDWDSPMAQSTRDAAATLSRRLGHGSVDSNGEKQLAPARASL